MAQNTVNFFQPGTDGALEQAQLQRQRDMAAMLMKQGTTPQQGQMVGGHYVAPSPLSYVNQLASTLLGKYKENQADERERQMVESLRTGRANEAKEFMSAMSGTPGRTIQPLTPNDDEGNAMPTAQTAAVAPDRNRAMALALQSQNPMLQTMGGDLMKRQMDAEEMKGVLESAGIGAPAAGSAPAGAPGAQGAAPSGGIPGIDPRAMALTLSRLPQAQKLGGMIQDVNKPMALAEGGTAYSPMGGPMYTAPKTEPGMNVTRDQRTGQALGVSEVPGYSDFRGSVAGREAAARQAAESANTMVQIDTPLGPRMVTRQQAIQLAGSMQPQAAPPAGGYRTEPQMATTAAINDNPVAAARSELAAMQREAGNVKDPASKAALAQRATELQQVIAAGGAGTQTATPPEYLALNAGGGRGSQGGAPAGAAPSGPGIALLSPDQKAYGEARAKGFAEQASVVQKTGQTGSSMLRNLDELRTLYADPNVAKGALAENISGLKNLGSSFGVDMKGLSSEQAAQAITNKMALDARSTADGGGMPGAMSDADRNFLKNLQPDLSKSPEGRTKIMDAMQKTAQRQIDVARMATEYEQKNGRLDAGFDKVVREYAAKNQMFTQAKPGGGFKIIGVK